MNRIRRVIGIDQSLNSSGITTLELNDCMEIVSTKHHYTTRKPRKKYPECGSVEKILVDKCTGRGFDRIYTQLDKVFQVVDFSESIVWLEDFAYNVQDLGTVLLRGALNYHLHRIGIPMEVVQIQTLKKFATGKGDGKKEKIFLSYESNFPNSEVLKFGNCLDRRYPLEAQLGNESKGSPLTDLIDSHFIALYGLEDLRNGN